MKKTKKNPAVNKKVEKLRKEIEHVTHYHTSMGTPWGAADKIRELESEIEKLVDPEKYQMKAFIRECVDLVQEIYSDTREMFRATGERMTEKKLIVALAEGAIEQVGFRGKTKFPEGGDYAKIEKEIRSAIKARYF